MNSTHTATRASLCAMILAISLLPIDLANILQINIGETNIAHENDGLSQEAKSRLEKLVKDNSVVVIGKLKEGKPTGNAYAHIFETSRILKGKPAELNVLMSHKSSSNQDDPLEDANPAVELPRLNVGEYVLILRAEEVNSSFRPLNPLGFLLAEPHFNYFIIRDAESHAAWPLGSLEEQCIPSLFANVGQLEKD